MSVSETAKRPESRGRSLGLWLAFLLLIGAGVGLAWLGASPLRGETTESGLRIRTVEKGEGPFVQAMDGVLVEYEGRLADGTVFDDSARGSLAGITTLTATAVTSPTSIRARTLIK